MHVLGELVGGHDAIARSIGRAYHALHHVVRENAVAALQIGGFKGALTRAAGSEREERLVQLAERVIQAFGILQGDGRGDGARVAGVGEQDLRPGPDLAAHHRAELIHRVTRGADVVQIDIGGRKVALSLVHESVAGEIDENAVVLLGDRG